RRQSDPAELSVNATVKGLQALLLAAEGAMLSRTIEAVWGQPVDLEDLQQLMITLYQEGTEQRVWRAQVTRSDGDQRFFGLIVARAPGPSSDLTQRDFRNLQRLHTRQPRYCATPYTQGDFSAGVAVYTVEWLDQHKELVFEITRDGGVFLVNAAGSHHAFTPHMSRRIWRQIMTILWYYPGLQGVNIQAGDFVGRLSNDETEVDLKLTTARECHSDPDPATRIHAMLGVAITASGYLSTNRKPFDRQMREEVFVHRMQAVLRRRFRHQALKLARQQWSLFRQGAFAQQEDWLKADCMLATYDRLRDGHSVETAWRETQQRWMAYAHAVETGALPPSWWFPAAEIPLLLDQLTVQYPTS
ncbi:MAG: hypothetical protein OEU26_06785, partial [Candidatus Tectomicrobia bacterium]|nr:hypothetical protein [Candidatus Tectomicrobia bacterium]